MRTNKRVGAVVVVDGKVLLIHRFKKCSEYWVLPGGGMEDGESLEEALDREVKEETSLDLASYEMLGLHEVEGTEHLLYRCELGAGVAEIDGPERADSSAENVYILEWIPLKQAETLESLYPEIVKEYFSKMS